MNISKTMEDAISSNNIFGIRSSFYTIVLSDPGFATGRFEKTLEYVKSKNIQGLIDEHNNKDFLEESDWNEEYCSLLASELQENFSLERIEHLIKVSKQVFKTAEAPVNKETFKNNDTNQKVNIDTDDSDKYAWIKGILVVVGIIAFIRWIFKE
ncbi:hypothetical protein SAMN02746066_04166 [Anaerosporobacter mobilis DSM 15930]|uniref:Uncharacterized protein n=1 Tax=Anaerosporobacter mobilis DSM 15930 TaxID=1120996 RepID=A0A1M7N358_9FIRM|nr:hypothetical protein [Anaerosporobacter mobilis]SHM97403.1 hypothetical protein SAMN02746066_04166 [Anaerosporobacter mobilis DSM 15930]